MSFGVKYMQHALALARKGMGKVSPNPMVGCVIVKNGKVIAQGYHHYYGGDHAEVDALKKAKSKAVGGTMYVTLEPCAHWGKTPPCVDAVIASGIRRVVVALTDPDPRTHGQSIRKLKSAGIAVDVGVCQDDAMRLNAAFIKNIKTQMPYVVVKTAQTMDGKVGTHSGKIKWITSASTRKKAKLRRDMFDAIVVGVNTVLSDDPKLDAPHKALVKVVVDSTLRTPLKSKIFDRIRPGQVIVATTKKASRQKIKAFKEFGIVVMVLDEALGGVDLKALFKALAKNGLIRILVEGGPTLATSVIHAGLSDQMHIYIAPKVMGPGIKDAVKGVDVASLMAKDILEIICVKRMGKDIFIESDVINTH
ncbi:MAG: bifunctional diaminohydroxyphosphoribosylaminopyrimidine deaminase/5-amino-6-(5-phosphoribosylamino)uracil reductase RibD [Candidatus Omnitrophota bacterium]